MSFTTFIAWVIGILIFIIFGYDEKSEVTDANRLSRYGGTIIPMLTVKIIIKSFNSGLHKDALCIQKVLRSLGGVNVIIASDKDFPRKVDCQIHVEHYFDKLEKYANINCLLVNHEFLYDWDIMAIKRLPKLQILTKTKIATKLVKDIARNPDNVINIGFTTDLVNTEVKQVDDPFICVHLAGSSPLKGTVRTIEAWLRRDKNNDKNNSRDKNKDKEVLIILTSKSPIPGLDPVERYWDRLVGRNPRKTELNFIESKEPIMFEQYENIYLSRNRVPNDVFLQLVFLGKVHICPSEIEGFGHIIAQGLAMGASVITTDFPPMNELVDNTCGWLVKCNEIEPMNLRNYDPEFKQYLNRAAVDVDDLARVINETIDNYNTEDSVERRANAKAKFAQMTEYFEQQLGDLVQMWKEMSKVR